MEYFEFYDVARKIENMADKTVCYKLIFKRLKKEILFIFLILM